MSDEIKSALADMNRAWEEFKANNEAKLKAEARGAADALFESKERALNEQIDKLGERLKAIEIKAARPNFGGQDAEGDESLRAFKAWMASGSETPEMKDLRVSVGGDGGFSVPTVIDNEINKFLVSISPMRQVSQVVTVSTPNYSKLVDISGTASGWVGETDARPATATPQFGRVQPTMGTLYANPQATQDVLEDSQFNLEAWLAEGVSEEFARAEGDAFINGNGTNRPTGFLNGTPVTTADGARAFGVLQYRPSGVAAAMPTSLDVIIDLVHDLKAGYRQGAAFMCNKATLAALRKYKDTTNQYLWQPSVQAGVPSSFLGFPVYEAENMPAIGANAFPLAFGNFRTGYLIVDRRAVITLRDPYTNKPFIGFYTTKRVGGAVQNSEAIKLLRTAAS